MTDRNMEETQEAPVPTDDELVLATEEQRNEMLAGGEIQWTDEQAEILGKDKGQGTQEADAPQTVLDVLDKTIQAEAIVDSKVKTSSEYQRLRKRAQAAEEREKEKERKLIELEAQNKAYKESLERLKPEEEYDLNDPDDLERYLAGKRDELEEDDKPESEYEVLPDEYSAAESTRHRFADADGNIYDGKVENPTGKPYFRVKDKEGKERVVFDREALDEYDQNMVQRFGEQLYNQMWGTRQQPGVMALWRDNAPTEQVMQVLSSSDPVLATLQVYRNILGALAAQQDAQKQGQGNNQRPHQPPMRKDVGPAPRGFGAAPITDSDAPPKQVSPIDVSDKTLENMTEEERNAWMAGD